MTPKQPTPTHSKKPRRETPSSMLADWQARHAKAIPPAPSASADAIEDTLPTWPPGVTQPLRAPEEQALIAMLRHWRRYGEELRQAAGTGYYLDTTFATLRQGWRQIGEGLCLLLHPELCDLNAQALEEAIRDALALPMEQEAEIREWNFFDDWEPSSEPDYEAHCYSRADALADGVLIDVTETAEEAGFRYPVALTQALWADIHAIPEQLQGIAAPKGRLCNVLFVGRCAIKQQASQSSSCLYHLEMPVGDAQDYAVKAVCGPGDSGEPVITLMQPGED